MCEAVRKKRPSKIKMTEIPYHGVVVTPFISFSQIWEFETTTDLIVGGKSNRAVLFFQEELKRIAQKAKSIE